MRVLVFCVCRAWARRTAGFLAHPRLVEGASCDGEGQEGNCECEAASLLE